MGKRYDKKYPPVQRTPAVAVHGTKDLQADNDIIITAVGKHKYLQKVIL